MRVAGSQSATGIIPRPIREHRLGHHDIGPRRPSNCDRLGDGPSNTDHLDEGDLRQPADQQITGRCVVVDNNEPNRLRCMLVPDEVVHLYIVIGERHASERTKTTIANKLLLIRSCGLGLVRLCPTAGFCRLTMAPYRARNLGRRRQRGYSDHVAEGGETDETHDERSLSDSGGTAGRPRVGQVVKSTERPNAVAQAPIATAASGPERNSFERTYSSSPFGVGRRNIATDEVWSNNQYYQVIGRTFDECHRIGWNQVVHPDDLQKYSTASELLVSVGTPLNLTIRFLRPDGGIRWTKVHSEALIGPGGTPAETTHFVIDVTDELRTQAELAAVADQLDRRNDELESSLDAFHDLRLRLTEDGTYVSVWAGDQTKLTRPVTELIRTNIAVDFPPQVTQRFLDAIHTTIATSSVTAVAFSLGDGEDRVHFEARLARVGATEVMAVIRDVSHVRALEAQLIHAQTMESVGRLAGGVAHDFNNVLHVIRGHASALARDLDNPEAAERRLSAIVRAVDRTSSLVEQLMSISRPTPNNPTPTVVDQFLLALKPGLQQVLGESIQLNYELNAPGRAVVIDDSRFENIILNLTTNARDAISTNGVVSFRTKLVGTTSVVIEVGDNGAGMDIETAARSFDLFFSTKSPGVGTGLGLANVYKAVTEAYGSIQVDSVLGRGSTFSIELPCVHVEIGAAESDVNSPLDHVDGATILVVDDNADLLDLCVDVLRYIGYSVLQAPSGAEALALIDESSSVDAVLIDVTMPVMTGPELAQEIRRRRPDLPVILMSGSSATVDDDKEHPFATDRILRKPFSDTELATVIRAVLE